MYATALGMLAVNAGIIISAVSLAGMEVRRVGHHDGISLETFHKHRPN